jgi:pyruvate/2-oxoglutarate dehydrogenase complex dihydrolipoamide dehydrogenase (E3) component
MNQPEFEALQPMDEHNRVLQSMVHPTNYRNPVPSGRYNLVVIGAGTAGLVAASVAAGLGGKVALIERSLMGGDCLNVGCVPSKALLSAARRAADVRSAGCFGVHVGSAGEPSQEQKTSGPSNDAALPVTVDFAAVMRRMRQLRSGISPHDSVQRFSDMGIDVYLGQASFVDDTTIEVDGQRLSFAKAVICTGARAAAPDLDGLDQVPYLTNETLFSLTELPRRLAVLGAGPIGAEMAQAFARFGSEVSLITSKRGLLPNEDREAAAIVQQSLEKDGICLFGGAYDVTVRSSESGSVILKYEHPEQGYDLEVDQLLVAAGRKPNVEGLGLENAGVAYDEQGVTISDTFQTSNKNIFAAGDICSPHKFTHAADFMARAVVRNALFKGSMKHSSLLIPRSTYTSPELAHIGLTPQDAHQQGIDIDTFTQPMSGVDRAILDGETEGSVRVHVKKGSDTILGATVVSSHAGDMIGAISLAMSQKIGLGAVANAIHPYPTQADAFRKVGDLYNRTRLTPFVARLFKRWLAWARK